MEFNTSYKTNIINQTFNVLLIITLFVLVCSDCNNNGLQSYSFFRSAFLLIIFLFLRITINIIGKDLCSLFLIIAISIWSNYESIKSILQIIKIIPSNNSLFICTGSFSNPGPLGGFLSVCAAIFLSWILSQKKTITTNTRGLFYFYICFSFLINIVVLPSSQSRAAILSFIISLCIFLLLNPKTRCLIIRHSILISIILALVAIYAYSSKKESFHGRLFINKINYMTMKRNGYHGVGIGNFSAAYGDTQIDYFSSKIYFDKGQIVFDNADPEIKIADNPAFAFNDLFQIGIEYGLFLLIVFVIICVFCLLILYQTYPPLFCGFCTMLIFSLFSYPFTMLQFQILLFSFLSYATFDYNKKNINLVLGLLIVILSYISIPSLNNFYHCKKAEMEWKELRFLYDQADYVTYERCCSKLFCYMKNNPIFLYEYANSLFFLGKFTQSEVVAEMGNALSCNSLFYILKGDLRNKQGDYIEAEALYKKAFYVLPDRLYPLYKLALLYKEQSDSLRLNNIIESINNFKPRIESYSTIELRELTKELKK